MKTKNLLLIADAAAGLPAPSSATAAVDKTVFTAAHAKTTIADTEALLKKLDGLTGHAVTLRHALESVRDRAAHALTLLAEKPATN